MYSIAGFAANHASKWGMVAAAVAAVAAAPVAYLTWRRTPSQEHEAQGSVFGCTPRYYSCAHPAHPYMHEMFDRLYNGQQKDMFRATVALIDDMEALIVRIDDAKCDRAERLRMPVRAIEILLALKAAFARLIECVKLTDPSPTKETELKENANNVRAIMERRINYISSRVQEFMLQSIK